MKKVLLLVTLLCIFLCGCSNDSWKKKVQISSVKLDNNYIVGKMKNLTDKAYDVTITFKTTSGSLDENKICYELLRPNETINLECLAFNMDDTYAIEIANVELNEKEIPKLKEGEIDVDTLKYHFEDIYNTHLLNFTSFSNDYEEARSKYPYIDEIKYNSERISIFGNFNKISFFEDYDTNLEKMSLLNIFVYSSDDEELLNNVATKISLMQSITTSVSDSMNIAKALRRSDIEYGKCIKVGRWCVARYKNDLYTEFYLEKQ